MESSTLQKYSVLHVDDNASFLKLFATRFRPYLDITSMESGKEALDILKDKHFDVVIVDYEMSEMNGLELLEDIKRNQPDLPVIFYTGQGNEEVAREAFILGVSDYFVKDISGFAYKERILNAVRNAVDKSKAEKALRESEESLEAIMQSISDAVIATDMKGRIILINPVAARLTGWKQDEALGRRFDEVVFLYSEIPDKRTENLIKKVLSQGSDITMPLVYLKSLDGTFSEISLSGALIRNKNGKTTGVVAAFRKNPQ